MIWNKFLRSSSDDEASPRGPADHIAGLDVCSPEALLQLFTVLLQSCGKLALLGAYAVASEDSFISGSRVLVDGVSLFQSERPGVQLPCNHVDMQFSDLWQHCRLDHLWKSPSRSSSCMTRFSLNGGTNKCPLNSVTSTSSAQALQKHCRGI